MVACVSRRVVIACGLLYRELLALPSGFSIRLLQSSWLIESPYEWTVGLALSKFLRKNLACAIDCKSEEPPLSQGFGSTRSGDSPDLVVASRLASSVNSLYCRSLHQGAQNIDEPFQVRSYLGFLNGEKFANFQGYLRSNIAMDS